MTTQPYLFKRGDVYQWRRKTRRFSTKIVDIKLSLGTTDRLSACILSRKVSAESDFIMEQIIQNRITDEVGRQYLARVIKTERAKIEKLRLLSRVDSLDPEGDTRHDEAARTAWVAIHDKGLNHHIAADTTELTRDNIEITRADLLSEARRRILKRDLKDLTGVERLSALEELTLRDLYIQAKAEAWSGSHQSSEQHSDRAPQSEVVPQVLPAKHCEEKERPDPRLSSLIERMTAIKRVEGIEEKTLRQYRAFAALFEMLTGIDDITKVTQTVTKSFRADLNWLPKSWGKSPKDIHLNRNEVQAKSDALPPEKIGLSVGTINRHLEHLNQIADWARDEGLPVDTHLKPAKLRKKDTVRARDKRDPFTVEQLRTVFRQPVWTGSRSEWHQTQPGDQIYRNGIYWCPLIGAYTGARREEIAGLAPGDIVQVEGIWCFNIEDSELRRIKNLSSRRIVPIHSHLLEMGFLTHVETTRRTGQNSLFPDLYEAGNNSFGRKLGRRMRTIIDNCFGEDGAKLSFHSLRHYAQNELANAGIESRIVRDIVGHEGEDVHDKVYTKKAPVVALSNAIAKLPKVT